MPTCSFCKRHYKEPRGLTVYNFEGRAIYYCSSKCRKNVLLGRESKKVNWAKVKTDVVSETENAQNNKASENNSKK